MRYSRQELVIGKKAQQKIASSTIAVIGLGALGTVAAELLARSGIKKLILIDRDIIEETNLQRQLLYTEKDIGLEKAYVAGKRLHAINSKINIDSHIMDINYKNMDMLKKVDLVLDCTDNLYTRFLLDEYCHKHKKPWVYAGVIKEQGVAMGITPNTPTFSCTVSETTGLDTCDTAGVLNSASACVASLQVQEALNILIDRFKKQRLIHFNLKTLDLSLITTRKNPKNSLFKGIYKYLEGKKEPKIMQKQCSDLYVFFKDIDFSKIKKKLKKIGKIRGDANYLFFKNLSIFKNGRILIKAPNLKRAKADLAKYIG